MKYLIVAVLLVSAVNTYGQNGYVNLKDGSTFIGFVRRYVAISDGHPGLEVWRTKTDKNPMKISKKDIVEYAIGKDTFKVFHQFKPFVDSNTYFECIDARRKSSGKVNLYILPLQNTASVSSYTGGGLIPAIIDEYVGNYPFFYVLEDEKLGYLSAVSSKKELLHETLLDFFPEEYVTKYVEVNGEIKYKEVPKLVQLYNTR